MRILYVATVRSHIGQFHMNFIKELVQQGHTVEIACKDNSMDKQGLDLSCIAECHYMPFERSPMKWNNIRAYKQLKKLLKEEHYDIIHCHTPMGGVITRLAAHSVKTPAKVLYTAHGFHFFQGASKKNWLLFYPVEKWLARYTDCLITINQEDYELAVKKKFHAGKIKWIRGVGVELSQYYRLDGEERRQTREEYGLSMDDFVLVYPADLSYRKNQKMLIEAVAQLKDRIPEMKVLLPGQPILQQEYEQLAKENGVEHMFKFMGYRRDIPKLLSIADIAVSTSRQEGLPVNLMEGMAAELPVIATKVRGNSEMVKQGENGYGVTLNDVGAMAEYIWELYKDADVRRKMGMCSKEMAQVYSVSNVNRQLRQVYEEYNCQWKKEDEL